MSYKDTLTKAYMAQPVIFADVLNYIIYNGEMIILPKDLKEKDSTEVALMQDIRLGKIHKGERKRRHKKILTFQKWRDILKKCTIEDKDGIRQFLAGVECQSEVHYAMPIRSLLYDCINYASQVRNIGQNHIKEKNWGKNQGEFLSGFHKDDRIVPVITITVYFGQEEWDGPRNMYEMFPKIIKKDQEIHSLLMQYPLYLIIPSEIEDFEKFHSEFGLLIKLIKTANQEGKKIKELFDKQAENTIT